MLFSMHTFPDWTNNTGWFANNFTTYIKMQQDASPAELEAKLPDFLVRRAFGGDPNAWGDNWWEWYLMPLHDIHLKSHVSGEFEANGSSAVVYIFATIALFVLLIACVNFMNLATARSAKRAREIGVRKVVGSTRGQLVRQFFGETAVMCGIALAAALLLVAAALPWFREFTGKEIAFTALITPVSVTGMVLLTIAVAVVSGSYPAVYLSAFQPVRILKGLRPSGSRRSLFRSALVVLQFAITIFLIAGTLILSGQLSFIQNTNLGFDKERILLIKNPYNVECGLPAFKERLQQLPDVKTVSYSNTVPGKSFSNWGVMAEGKNITLNTFVVDEDFAGTYGMEMADGRFFSRDFATDSSAIIINESAVNILEWDDAINKGIRIFATIPRTTIGVVKDFHYESMRIRVRAAALLYQYDLDSYWPAFASVRFDTRDVRATVAAITDVWDDVSGGLPLDYGFFDEEYDRLYSNEMRAGRVMTLFSVLSIAIACLGLFGLASFSAAQRTAEIGIRKTLGASAGTIYRLLLREFLMWVIAANVIAWPVAWFLMNKWLATYAYRIEISLVVFFVSGLAALAVALLTVSHQAFRASRTNIVNALKYE